MAVTINSNGTITGIAVGGLPDGVVDTDTLAADAVTAAKVADDVVNSEHLVDGGVDNAHLASGVDAAKVTTGTLPMARLSGTLPALNGSSLTSLPAATSVAFPASQSASANANTLDDYEEGTFTPVLHAATNDNHTMSTQKGFYTKVGGLVTVACHYVHLSGGSSSGDVTISGFPFPCRNITHHTPIFNWGYCTSASITAGFHFSGFMTPNLTTLTMKTWDATGGTTTTQFSEIPAYVTMAFGGTYQTNT